MRKHQHEHPKVRFRQSGRHRRCRRRRRRSIGGPGGDVGSEDRRADPAHKGPLDAVNKESFETTDQLKEVGTSFIPYLH